MGFEVSGHHMSFPVSDLGRSRAFYEGVLGLEQIPRPDFGPVRGVWYQAGPVQVHLILHEGMDPVSTGAIEPGSRHAAFAVADYETARRRLEELGVAHRASAVTGQIFCHDPDGHTIELIQPGVLNA